MGIAHRQRYFAASVSIYWGLGGSLEQYSMQISDMNLAFVESDYTTFLHVSHLQKWFPLFSSGCGHLLPLQGLANDLLMTRRFALAISANTCSSASRSPSCLFYGRLRFRHIQFPTPAPSLEIPFIFHIFTSANSSSISTHSNHW